MTSGKKKRMSMLDSLADARAPAPSTSMMASNRALRSARDAVDSHTVWELDPNVIEDTRPEDRLDRADVADLIDAIEANGQTVPILVRRNPSDPERYLLVYGRRRLEAIRQSAKVEKVRALVATLDDRAALTAQISENMARRDLSYIEKALFADRLVESGYGTQAQVAEVLTVSKSAISMALAVVASVGRELIEAIGPAHGIGRPRWEALARAIEDTQPDREHLVDIASRKMSDAEWSGVLDDAAPARIDPSVAAFEAVMAALEARRPRASRAPRAVVKSTARKLRIDEGFTGAIRRTKRGLNIEVQDGPFADWLDDRADTIMTELHAQWKSSAED